MKIEALDHLVLTVQSTERTCQFYRVLGMRVETFGNGRTALHFGTQKINLHQVGSEIAPHALHPLPGSADLCFVTQSAPDEVLRHLQENGIDIELGPVERTGAVGNITSVYVRDPDGNLVEIASYDNGNHSIAA